METVAIKMDDDLHKRLKLFAIHQDKIIAEIVMSITKKLKQKEQTR